MSIHQSLSKPIFLSAEWKNLLMINYKIDPDVLTAFLPRGTELDTFEGDCFVSLVCFQFLNTKIKGLAIPFHSNFEEVNLRFYVRRKRSEIWERGVVFIKELVPKHAIAWVANVLYNENYQVAQMKSSVRKNGNAVTFEHIWKLRNTSENRVKVVALGEPKPASKGTIEEYIAEHYFGYVKQRDGSTKEYEVKHSPWRIWHDCHLEMTVDFAKLYGEI